MPISWDEWQRKIASGEVQTRPNRKKKGRVERPFFYQEVFEPHWRDKIVARIDGAPYTLEALERRNKRIED